MGECKFQPARLATRVASEDAARALVAVQMTLTQRGGGGSAVCTRALEQARPCRAQTGAGRPRRGQLFNERMTVAAASLTAARGMR